MTKLEANLNQLQTNNARLVNLLTESEMDLKEAQSQQEELLTALKIASIQVPCLTSTGFTRMHGHRSLNKILAAMENIMTIHLDAASNLE